MHWQSYKNAALVASKIAEQVCGRYVKTGYGLPDALSLVISDNMCIEPV